MPILLKELSAQQFEQARAQLKRRRNNRYFVIACAYGLIALAGGAMAALTSGGQFIDFAVVVFVVLTTLFLAIGLHSILEIRRSDLAINKSLDIIAAMRGMAYEANAPKPEFDRITDQYRALFREQSRNFFGKTSNSILFDD